MSAAACMASTQLYTQAWGQEWKVVFFEWPLGIVATRNRCTADFLVATINWQDAEGVGATVGNELLIEALTEVLVRLSGRW